MAVTSPSMPGTGWRSDSVDCVSAAVRVTEPAPSDFVAAGEPVVLDDPVVVDTSLESPLDLREPGEAEPYEKESYRVAERSVVMLVAR